MPLQPTNLVLAAAQLPADFEGTPQELFTALVRRLKILSTTGTNTFVVGDVEPSTNQGPWLKNGNKWYVFDIDAGGYVPIDVSDSTEHLFTTGDIEPEAPTDDDAFVWLRTWMGRVIDWYFWDGTAWRPSGKIPPSGTTATRPTQPRDLEQYFDTDINVLLHWERGAWRTVSGSPGDVKFVSTEILTTALTANPGWEYVGESDQDAIGRVIGVASKDPGATPESSFATTSGITPRAAGDDVGSETHILTSLEIEQHTHLVGALQGMNLANGGNSYFYRVDNNESFSAPTPRPPNYAFPRGEGTTVANVNGELPSSGDGTMFVTSKQLSLSGAAAYTKAAQAHNNLPPTRYLWALTKQ